LLVEQLGCHQVLALEEPRVRARVEAPADLAAEEEAGQAAEDRRRDADRDHERQLQPWLALKRREEPGGEKKAVTWQKEANEEAGLRENDREQPDVRERPE